MGRGHAAAAACALPPLAASAALLAKPPLTTAHLHPHPQTLHEQGGIYHGRILMPAEYPFKPPAFVMLTPSGRFETGVKICLSISSHHPESWQPSWSVRSALVALIAFMQTPGNGALGSLDHPTAARCQMAAESRTRPPAYGSAERQELIATMHQRMLDLEERSRALLRQEKPPAESPAAETAEAAAAEAEAPAAEAEPAASPAGAVVAEPAAAEQQAQQQEAAAAPAAAAPALGAAASAAARPAALPAPAAEPELRQRPAAAGAAAVVQPLWQEPPLRMPQPMHGREVEPTTDALRRADDRFARQRTGVPPQSWEDRSLTYLAVVLALCIGALVIRKVRWLPAVVRVGCGASGEVWAGMAGREAEVVRVGCGLLGNCGRGRRAGSQSSR